VVGWPSSRLLSGGFFFFEVGGGWGFVVGITGLAAWGGVGFLVPLWGGGGVGGLGGGAASLGVFCGMVCEFVCPGFGFVLWGLWPLGGVIPVGERGVAGLSSGCVPGGGVLGGVLGLCFLFVCG